VTNVASDRGIVTLCDANYFPGLLMLHRSVQESHPCMIACYDLGCTEEQRAIGDRLENLQFLPLPQDPLIEQIKCVMGLSAPLQKLHKRVWPLWICPVLIKHAPFRDVIWMDCDLVVLRDLENLFDQINSGPVFTPENKAPHLTANHPELYDLLPIYRSFDRLLPHVNAGVSGWRKDRDAEAIAAYLRPVERAIADKNVRDAIAWHDQGALIWAIQSCGLENRVAGSATWNLCVDNTPLAGRSLPWNDDFLSVVRAEVPEANIVHWNGNRPPWASASVPRSGVQ
jgi:hypothetical protein